MPPKKAQKSSTSTQSKGHSSATSKVTSATSSSKRSTSTRRGAEQAQESDKEADGAKSTSSRKSATSTSKLRQSSSSRSRKAQTSSEDSSEDEKPTPTTSTPKRRSSIKPGHTSTRQAAPAMPKAAPRFYPLLNKEIDASNFVTDSRGRRHPADSEFIQQTPANSRFATDDSMRSTNVEQSVGNRRSIPRRSFVSSNPTTLPTQQPTNLLRSALLFILVFCLSIAGIYILLTYMPVSDADRQFIKLPRDIEQCKQLAAVVDRYKDDHPIYVFALFAAVYGFLQAFTIPGAVFLSILAGPIWGVTRGIFIISFVATLGSSLSFLLSKTITRPLLLHFFPNKIKLFRDQLDQNKDNLWFYLLFLRIAPVFPNWLITLSSPVIGVPWVYFATATFIGIMPNNYIMTTIGTSLASMNNDSKLLTPSSMLSLCGVAFLAILPVLLKRMVNAKKPEQQAV